MCCFLNKFKAEPSKIIIIIGLINSIEKKICAVLLSGMYRGKKRGNERSQIPRAPFLASVPAILESNKFLYPINSTETIKGDEAEIESLISRLSRVTLASDGDEKPSKEKSLENNIQVFNVQNIDRTLCNSVENRLQNTDEIDKTTEYVLSLPSLTQEPSKDFQDTLDSSKTCLERPIDCDVKAYNLSPRNTNNIFSGSSSHSNIKDNISNYNNITNCVYKKNNTKCSSTSDSSSSGNVSINNTNNNSNDKNGCTIKKKNTIKSKTGNNDVKIKDTWTLEPKDEFCKHSVYLPPIPPNKSPKEVIEEAIVSRKGFCSSNIKLKRKPSHSILPWKPSQENAGVISTKVLLDLGEKTEKDRGIDKTGLQIAAPASSRFCKVFHTLIIPQS